MKKRILLIISILFIVTILFSGCMFQDIGVKLSKKNGGTITMTFGLKKDIYNKLVADGKDPFENMETTEYKYNDSIYVAYSETKTFATYDALASALLDISYNTDFINENFNQNYNSKSTSPTTPLDISPSLSTEEEKPSEKTDSMKIFEAVSITRKQFFIQSEYTFNATFKAHQIEYKNEFNEETEGEVEYDLGNIYRFSLSVEMPGNIVSHSEGSINGNIITFNVTDVSQKQDIFVTSQTDNDYIIYTAIGILGLLAILVVCFVIASKPKEA